MCHFPKYTTIKQKCAHTHFCLLVYGTPNHYLSQCWHIINGALWHHLRAISAEMLNYSIKNMNEKRYTFKLIATTPRGQWVKLGIGTLRGYRCLGTSWCQVISIFRGRKYYQCSCGGCPGSTLINKTNHIFTVADALTLNSARCSVGTGRTQVTDVAIDVLARNGARASVSTVLPITLLVNFNGRRCPGDKLLYTRPSADTLFSYTLSDMTWEVHTICVHYTDEKPIGSM